MTNNGQACINAKRFIVVDKLYDQFKDKLINHIELNTVIGDPMNKKDVTLGPLAIKHLTQNLRQ